jgi:hypothetical protein
MTASVQSPADLVNLALTRIGYKGRIGNLFEGSPASKKALDVYSQTRDELLRENIDWGFSERNVAMTLLKFAPLTGYIPPVVWNPVVNPSLPWLFEYAYPSDALDVRAVKPVPPLVLSFDPQPNVFAVENDNAFTPPQRVILCNVPGALLTYTGQITDLTTWDADAVEAFAATLARRIGPVLMGPEIIKAEVPDEAQAVMVAREQERG